MFERSCSASYENIFVSQEVINMFGRYPQRNKALGRENTPEEEQFLKNIPDRYKW